MTPQALAPLALSAAFTAAANLLIRHGLMSVGGFDLAAGSVRDLVLRLGLQPAFVLGVILYGLAAVLWFRVLSVAEVSSAYPVLVGFTFVLVTAGAVIVFGESTGALKLAGLSVILVGIVMVAQA